MNTNRTLHVLGTRGIPAAHGGFETFAERFALHMYHQGWKVTVYCQSSDGLASPVEDLWCGIRRITFSARSGALGTMQFDLRAVRHAAREGGVMLMLGYNTALFSTWLRFKGHPLATNMDGIEWRRAKWPLHGRIWLYINEWIAALTSNKLVADHPAIAERLGRMRSSSDIMMIPYGADLIQNADSRPTLDLGLTVGGYLLSIGRIEPENNILPIIRAYTRRPRKLRFVCLGRLEPATNAYHAAVIEAGGDSVLFPGAIYDGARVQSLRFHAAAYCHGHSVGGTNPSLVEALGAGNAVIAHDNVYNRWVAGDQQLYFRDEDACAAAFDLIEADPVMRVRMSQAARRRVQENFRWLTILDAYQSLCESLSKGRGARPKRSVPQ